MKYVLISGLNIHDNNRGTAALGYGSVSFLHEKGWLSINQEIIGVRVYKKFWRRSFHRSESGIIRQNGKEWKYSTCNVFILQYLLIIKFGIVLPFTKFGHIIRNTSCVAAINGGDGFSDIYGTDVFNMRLPLTKVALALKIPHIILPQTLGPFEKKENLDIAEDILKKSVEVYVRDDKFVSKLREWNVNFSITKDLSAFMCPEPWDIRIIQNSIGLNISGLCYSNKFRTLAGHFDAYPELISRIIEHFQQKGRTIYLIPHSYNYKKPEYSNDDLVACKEAYTQLKNKAGVILIDKDLTSPQIKYLISKMSFFIGSRMHANFAAIYTGIPLYGLAYSYKFEGAFVANGIINSTYMVNKIDNIEIENVIKCIDSCYSMSIEE